MTILRVASFTAAAVMIVASVMIGMGGITQKDAPARFGLPGPLWRRMLMTGLTQTARVWITAIPACAFASGRLHELTASADWRMQQPLGPDNPS